VTNPASIFAFLYCAESLPCVIHAGLQSVAHFRRQRAGIEVLAGADIDLGETCHRRLFGKDRRAELQYEI
jgi:hypothetical protein